MHPMGVTRHYPLMQRGSGLEPINPSRQPTHFAIANISSDSSAIELLFFIFKKKRETRLEM
jgi:hypothetical protein